MGETLGVGLTHYPPMLGPPETYANLLRATMKSPLIPEEMKDSRNWPAPMQDEYSHELERAQVHQEQSRLAFRRVRQAIDEFNPDVVVIFGDDQYENFKEDVIPPFNVYVVDEFSTQPFWRAKNNIWERPTDDTFHHKGHKELAKHLATELIEREFPVSFSFQNLHFEHGLSHAFANALVFLDWDRQSFPYPVVPIQVNCYGSGVISSRGLFSNLFPDRPRVR